MMSERVSTTSRERARDSILAARQEEQKPPEAVTLGVQGAA